MKEIRTPEADAAGPSPSTRIVELLVRVVLVLAAMGLLSLAQRRFVAWQAHYSSTFRMQVELWVLYVGLVALSGLAFGLAAWPPRRPFAYRWGLVVVLGIEPLVLLAHVAFLWGWGLPHGWKLPHLLQRSYFFEDLGPQFALAVMLGVAIAAGFAPRRQPASPADPAGPPRPAEEASLRT